MSGGGTVNKVILIGRLGKPPEVRYTSEGTAVANFSLATDETFTDRAGDKQRRTQWHRIVAWKRLAEVAGEFLTAGKQVFVEGSLRSRKWQDHQGNERTTFEVVATRMVMLSSKPGTQQVSNRSNGKDGAASQSADAAEVGDESLPF